ncbi:abortive phage infection protein [Absiella sp. AM09-50]|jgi:predicted transcriptional regulator of viral defense system|nr:abortive phage infection protein [Absiella sp. AM22-9]RGB62332.1 abortive phage infection protein [Absiella sp. AM10-20]RGB67735.1 abortive phage infection protein [Absiella sp. AM09-45]RGB77461.1 abortive phage infection protein [Absiella sp. AM09-50]RHU07319.1 abortive phage infection protein [Absiella sp. AM27-20]
MSNMEVIDGLLMKNNGILTTRECKKMNIPFIYISRMIKEKKLEKIDRGIYISNDGDLDDYYFFQNKYKKSIYSYQSALYLHKITDRIPYKIEVTMYKGYNPHSMKKNDIEIHFVDKKYFYLGLTEVETAYGNKVRVYDKERTICDLIKHRNDIDEEIFRKAIYMYLACNDKNLSNLYEYANIMKIQKKLDDLMVLANG